MKRPIFIFLLACLALVGACNLNTVPETMVPVPKACFSLDTTNCFAPNCAVSFDASCSENAQSYSWDFGDGTTGSGITANHTFTKDSTYTIRLTVTGQQSQSHDTTLTLTVPASQNQDPCQGSSLNADFSIFNNQCKAPCEISFNNNSVNATTYQWDFGDGATATGAFPVHIYPKAGSYNIKLVVSDGACLDSTIRPVNINWEQYELTFSDWDYQPTTLIQTSEGGYLCTGYVSPLDSSSVFRIFLMKFAQDGQVEWFKTYGDNSYFGNVLVETPDNGFVVGGNNSGNYLLKTNSQGQVVWERRPGSANNLGVNNLLIASDGGFVISGEFSVSPTPFDWFLMKTNSLGSEVWSQTYGKSDYDQTFDMANTQDGGYILTGYANQANGTDADFFVVKTSPSGQQQWNRTIDVGDEIAYGVVQTHDGGYAVAGWTTGKGAGLDDAYLVRLNSSGQVQWDQTFGTSGRDKCYAMAYTLDRGYIMTGYTSIAGSTAPDDRDIYLVKADSLGNQVWSRSFGGAAEDVARTVVSCTDGGYIVAGAVEVSATNNALMLIKTDDEGNTN